MEKVNYVRHKCLIANRVIKSRSNELPCPCISLSLIRNELPLVGPQPPMRSSSSLNMQPTKVPLYSDNTTIRIFEKESSLDNWVTSGKLGSKDAVLVFKTSVLNTSNPEDEMQTYSGSSTSSLNIGIKDSIDYNEDDTDDDEVIKEADKGSGHVNDNGDLHDNDNPMAKVLLSLPKSNSTNIKNSSNLRNPNFSIGKSITNRSKAVLNHYTNETADKKIPSSSTDGNSDNPLVNASKSPKKRLHDEAITISTTSNSSDNSMSSSECDNSLLKNSSDEKSTKAAAGSVPSSSSTKKNLHQSENSSNNRVKVKTLKLKSAKPHAGKMSRSKSKSPPLVNENKPVRPKTTSTPLSSKTLPSPLSKKPTILIKDKSDFLLKNVLNSANQLNTPSSTVMSKSNSLLLKSSFIRDTSNNINKYSTLDNSKIPKMQFNSAPTNLSFLSSKTVASQDKENIQNSALAKAKLLASIATNSTLVSSMQKKCSNENGKFPCNTDDIAYDMPANLLKITFKFMSTETKLLRKIFVKHGLAEAENEQSFNILWTGTHIKPDILRSLTPYQRVNHFPRSYELTRKDRLYKNIEKMQHLRGFKHFDIIPQSFSLPLEYRDLVTAHNKYRGPWIVKPAASSRGRGIFIVNNPDQIPMEEQLLVSKYIQDPLCIDGHKCDLRVYVVVTSFDPLVIYLYEEGLVRLATVKYNRKTENLWNPCMHLCNYSINKYHSDYIKSRDPDDEDVGHKWTLSALLRHLKNQGCDISQLMCNIEDIIIKSLLACAQSIISACRMFVPSGNNCFELYGFDILIDDTLKPWLLEVNLSPSLGIDTPLDTKVKASLLTDLLTLVGIPACTPMMKEHYDNKWTRFRAVTYSRRTNSADPLTCSANMTTHSSGTSTTSTSLLSSQKKAAGVFAVPQQTLTAEEARIVKNAKLQNARRGGFVRIFPTEDIMQRYGGFLDPLTGIPISTTISTSQSYALIMPHNYNQMLFNQLYRNGGKFQNNSLEERMKQYERTLDNCGLILNLNFKRLTPKSIEAGKRLRKQIRKLIESGHEMTQLQSRKAFSFYLENILRRLQEEPRSYHEKLILKFLNRMSDSFRPPAILGNPLSCHIIGKDRTAMVAKLLGDYLESYNRDTEAYIDSFDQYGMIPIALFNEFIQNAQESDLESILTLHTRLTNTLPFLYNRCGQYVPPTPPIPTGAYGFLKALPNMAPSGSHYTDQSKIDRFYKYVEPRPSTEKSKKKLEKTQKPISSGSTVAESNKNQLI